MLRKLTLFSISATDRAGLRSAAAWLFWLLQYCVQFSRVKGFSTSSVFDKDKFVQLLVCKVELRLRGLVIVVREKYLLDIVSNFILSGTKECEGDVCSSSTLKISLQQLRTSVSGVGVWATAGARYHIKQVLPKAPIKLLSVVRTLTFLCSISWELRSCSCHIALISP